MNTNTTSAQSTSEKHPTTFLLSVIVSLFIIDLNQTTYAQTTKMSLEELPINQRQIFTIYSYDF